MKFIPLLFLLLSVSSYSQSVTFECYVNDTLDNVDCTVCNQPGDVEIYTGLIVQKGLVRTKIYYPYGLDLRGTSIVIFDNKAHSVYFNLDSTVFNNYDELITWLKFCHFPDAQFVDSLFIVNDTLGISLSNSDSIKKVKLPPGFVDTDNQKIDTFYTNSDSIYIKIEDDPRTWAAPITYDIIGTLLDTQKIRTFKISNDTIYIRIDSDTTHFAILPDGFDTDEQFFDSVSFSLDTFRFSLVRDTQALFEIPFTKYLDNTDTQKVIVFNRIKDTLFLQISNDTLVFTTLPKTDTQRINLFQRSGDTIKIRIDGDTTHQIILPIPVDTDTDNYVDSVTFNNSNRVLSLSRTNPLSTLFDTIPDSDNQYFDSLFIMNDSLYASIFGDLKPASIVSLSGYKQTYLHTNGTNTYINNLSNMGGTWSLTATNNITLTSTLGAITLSVPFEKDSSTTNELQSIYWGNVTFSAGYYTAPLGLTPAGNEIKFISNANLAKSGNDLVLTIADNSATNEAQSLTTSGATTVTSTLSQISGVGGGFITHQTTPGISLSHASNIVTWSVNDKDSTNEIQTIDTFTVKKTTKGDSLYISLSKDKESFKAVFFNKHLDSVWFNNTTDTLYLRVRDTILKVKIPDDGAIVDNDNYVDTVYYSTNDTIVIGRTGALPDLKIKITHPTFIDNYVDTSFLNSTFDTLTIGRNILPDLKIRFPYRDSQTLLIVGTDSLRISRGNTIKLPISPDNYADSLTFDNSSRILYLSRNILSTLFDTIPDSDNQYLDSFLFVGTTLYGSVFNDLRPASGVNLSSLNQGYVHTGTNFYTNTLTNGGANNTFTLLGSTGIILSHNNSITTFRAADSSATNELQNINTVGLVVGLTQSSSNVTFASANANLTITQSGTAANSTLTFNVPTQIDNYVTGATFNDSQDSLLITRNLLSTIRLKIPDTDSQTLYKVNPYSIGITRGNVIDLSNYIDHDWYNFRTKQPATSITDTIYTKNFVGINDTTPDNDLDVEGVFSLRNRQGVGETRIDMNWNTTTGNSSDYVYHIDFNRDNTDVKDGTYQGYIDYHLHDAYPTMTTASYGRMVFGINNGGNAVTNTLILHKDTAVMHNARIEFKLKDKDYSSGNQGNILTSFNGTNIKWDSLKAGPGIIINSPTLTITAKDTSSKNEIQGLTPYIVLGDTIGILLYKALGVYDTVIFWSDTAGTSGGSGGGTAYTFSHLTGTGLTSTLNPSAGSIAILQGTQIEVLGSGSGINGIATIRNNFNGCQTCIPFFGANAGFVNDSLITDILFKFYYDEGIPTLEVPTVTLTQTNQYTNPVALYITQNNDERVYTSSIDATGFTSGNFYHTVASNGVTITIPSGHTGPSTHHFINSQGFTFTLQRSGSETIDGLTSQSFTANDKLVIIANDGAGKWVTSKATASASSGNISYAIGPASPPQSIGTTTMSDIQNSTSPSIPAGRYIVRVNVKANSWGIGEGYAMQLAAVTGSVTLNIGKWQVYDCTGTTITLNQFGIGSPTANSGISCNSTSIIYGECDITVGSASTIKIQLGVETSGRAANIWSGTVELFKIG